MRKLEVSQKDFYLSVLAQKVTLSVFNYIILFHLATASRIIP